MIDSNTNQSADSKNYIVDDADVRPALRKCGIIVLAQIQSVRSVSAYNETHIDLAINSPELSVLPESQDTATLIVSDELSASKVYEALNEVKRMNWSVMINAPCVWANDSGGVHLHDCQVSIIRQSLTKIIEKESEKSDVD